MRVDAFKPRERLCKRPTRRLWLLILALAVVALALAGCHTDAVPPAPDQPTALASAIAQQTASPEAQTPLRPTTTATTPPATCGAIPTGWVEYVVDIGDTLSGLAERAGLTVEALQRANCLSSDELFAAQRLWLPALPAATPTPCVAVNRPGWGGYLVRAGDTLASLAAVRGILPEEIVRVNCLASEPVAPGSLILLPSIILAPAAPAVALPAPAPAPAIVAPAQPAPPAAPAPSAGSATPAAVSGDSGANPGIRESAFLVPPNAPTLLYSVGDPNLPDPCPNDGKAHVITPLDGAFRGIRALFYFCGFTDPNSIAVRVAGPPSSFTSLRPTLIVFGRDRFLPRDPNATQLDTELATMQQAANEQGHQGVVVWYPTCEQPLGDYQLFLTDGTGSVAASEEFLLQSYAPQQGQIMLAPKIGAPGATFDIFYCDYPPNRQIQIRMYHEDATQRGFCSPAGGSGEQCRSVLRPTGYWIVETNSLGWTKEKLKFSPKDPVGMYRFCDNLDLQAQTCNDSGAGAIGEDTIWISPRPN